MGSLQAKSPIDGRRYARNAIWLAATEAHKFLQVKGRGLDLGKDAAPRSFNGDVVWVGPSERLLLSGETNVHTGHARDISSGLVAIAMKGKSVRRLVENETSAVDFTPGFASKLRFADVSVTIIVRGEDDLLCLVERSVASWLFDWLEDRAKLLDL